MFAHLSNDTEIGYGGMFLGSGTNNSAEWHGAVASLQFAKDVLNSPIGLTIKRVIIRMDSMLVVKQLTGEWKIKEPRLKVFHDQATGIVGELNIPVKFEWVRREHNTDADQIANRCLDERSTIGPVLTAAKSTDRARLRNTAAAKQNRKIRRVQFSLDKDTYTAFQEAVRKNQSTPTQVLVNAVKQYLQR